MSLEDRAGALMAEARDLLLEGSLDDARARVEEVAAIWRELGDPEQEARCLRLAASFSRYEGKLDAAAMQAALATAVAPRPSAQAASAHAELARIAMARGDAPEAAAHWGDAVAAAEGMSPAEAAPLLHGHAGALALAGRGEEAMAQIRRSRDLLASAGDGRAAGRALVEGATIFQAAGDPSRAAELAADAESAARASEDHEALASLALLASARALDAGDLATARREAERARAESLEARVAMTYVGAAVAIAEMADKAGDRVGAYASLATGWVTLADLLGRDVAQSVFEPQLLELRGKWGEDAFDAVRATYEEERRRQPDDGR